MTDIDEIRLGDWDDGNAGAEPPSKEPFRRRRRRETGPKANPFWRFVFPVMVIVAGVAAVQLSAEGARRVLDSTDGTELEIPADPGAPGYQVFVEPTPTMLLAQLDGDELVGVTVLSRTRLDNGGTVRLVDPFLRVEDPASGDLQTLHSIYRDFGLDGIEGAVGDLFGFGFTEVAHLETVQLGAWMTVVEPIPFVAVDDLIQLDPAGDPVVWLERGQGSKLLDGTVAAEVYALSNPGEGSANRTERQLDLWTAWIAEIAQAADLVAATLPFDEGLSLHLRALAQAADVQVLAANPVTFGGADTEYELSESQASGLAALAEDMVPLPISPAGQSWPAVRLLDGTGNSANLDAAVRGLAHSGVEIAVVGNAREFGVTETVVAYHRSEDEGVAVAVAESLGASAELIADPNQPVVLTITIGSDWEPA